MYNVPRQYTNPYYANAPMYNMYPYFFWPNPQMYNMYPNTFWGNRPMHNTSTPRQPLDLMDYGPNPFVVDIGDAAEQNNNFRTVLWTGNHMQVTLMSISVGDDIGLEIHPDIDQFIFIEDGQGIVRMGDSEQDLNFQREVYDDFAIVIPAGKWHNIINTGRRPLKLYAIYAPPQHPRDTVHKTKSDAAAAEMDRYKYRY